MKDLRSGNVKRVGKFLVLLLLFTSTSNIVYAHSGRTDGSGGHNCSDKSIAKGLCTGYHYHNGGGASSGSSSSTSTDTYSGPTAEEIAAQEKSAGQKAGYSAGVNDGYNNQNESLTYTDGSYDYQEGYDIGYQKGFEDGQAKLNSEKQVAYQTGYTAAKNGATNAVPANYNTNAFIKAAYQEGYNKSIAEIDKVKKKEYLTKGYSDGKKDVSNVPKDIKAIYVDSYQEGYAKGQKELKAQYAKQGYEAAYTNLKYKEPNFKVAKYVNWYKGGFESNKEVQEIKDQAYELGFSGSTYTLPKQYNKGKVIFEHYYEIGATAHEEKQKEDAQQTAGMSGALILGWLARRYYVARQTIK